MEGVNLSGLCEEVPEISVDDSHCVTSIPIEKGSCCAQREPVLTPMSLIYSVIPVVDAYVTPLSLCKPEERLVGTGRVHTRTNDTQLKTKDNCMQQPGTPDSGSFSMTMETPAVKACCSSSSGCCRLNWNLVSNAGPSVAAAVVKQQESGSSSSTLTLMGSEKCCSVESLQRRKPRCSAYGVLFVLLAVGAVIAAAIALYVEFVVKPDAAATQMFLANMTNSTSSLSIDPSNLPASVRDFIVNNENIHLEVATEKTHTTKVPVEEAAKTEVKFSDSFLSALRNVASSNNR